MRELFLFFTSWLDWMKRGEDDSRLIRGSRTFCEVFDLIREELFDCPIEMAVLCFLFGGIFEYSSNISDCLTI